jgi:hypothetical protein
MITHSFVDPPRRNSQKKRNRKPIQNDQKGHEKNNSPPIHRSTKRAIETTPDEKILHEKLLIRQEEHLPKEG